MIMYTNPHEEKDDDSGSVSAESVYATVNILRSAKGNQFCLSGPLRAGNGY